MFTLNEVRLRPLEPSDVECCYRWHLDIGIEILSGWAPRQSRDGFGKSFQRFLDAPNESMKIFGIEVRSNLVGRIDLTSIDRLNRTAAIGLFIAGDENRGKAYGADATRVMSDYAFTVENLERIYGYVYAFNTPCMRMLERVGFVKEGVLRSHEVHNGARHDMHVFGMLKTEFQARYGTQFMVPLPPPA